MSKFESTQANIMNFQTLLQQVEQHVINFFEHKTDTILVYHNKKHTLSVVRHASEIADHYQLNDEDYFIVLTAAWFHDLGYFVDPAKHEENGAKLADDMLQSLKLNSTIIEKVKGCILATKMPQNPNGLLQQIVCDADLYHLGTDSFINRSKLLKKEIEGLKGIKIDKRAWREKNIEMLSSHQYYTDFVKLKLQDQYEKNLQKLLSKKKEVDNETSVHKDLAATPSFAINSPETAKKKKTDRPERGIETMFRITSGNNQRLSDMADNKAHILITVNSIILSAIISLVLRKLEESAFLTIPTFILLSVSLFSMIFSILATRPTIPHGIFSQEDINSKKVNLLFFGNFYKMHLEEYSAGMQKVMNDKEFLYSTLIRDVYSQGVVLGRKYRLLRIAYSVFMFGLIVSVLAFIIASVINNHLQ